MRNKEEAHDYRYFPDPDLLPLELDAAWVKEVKASLPELPDEKKARFVKDSGLPVYDAGVLVADRDTDAFFETVAEGRDPKLAANSSIGHYFGALNRSGAELSAAPCDAATLGGLREYGSTGGWERGCECVS